MPSTTSKAKYWILTIKQDEFSPVYLPRIFAYLTGQLEEGARGFIHWQVFGITSSQCRLSAIKAFFPTAHIEPTRSSAAEDYCLKDDTAVVGTRFELGNKPLKRNSSKDWESIKSQAKSGELDLIPGDVFVRCYNSLKRIAVDHSRPAPQEREVVVFWGRTGSGKSRRAWEEATFDAYPKDPRTKFWDGYRAHENVVIDEFRGGIDIAHLLRWFDRYPVLVEIKGSSAVLAAKKIWITSNLSPQEWYPGLDEETLNALLRRLTITQFE